jgi:hypothetical protein
MLRLMASWFGFFCLVIAAIFVAFCMLVAVAVLSTASAAPGIPAIQPNGSLLLGGVGLIALVLWSLFLVGLAYARAARGLRR